MYVIVTQFRTRKFVVSLLFGEYCCLVTMALKQTCKTFNMFKLNIEIWKISHFHKKYIFIFFKEILKIIQKIFLKIMFVKKIERIIQAVLMFRQISTCLMHVHSKVESRVYFYIFPSLPTYTKSPLFLKCYFLFIF